MKVLKEQKGLKDKKGITLIALVVTIVVLIVLATVSILAVFGDNGIITRAQKAKDTHEEGKADETNTLDDYASYINGYLPKKAGDVVEKPTTWTSNNITPIDGGDGKAVPLPNGFYYVGGNISTGLVISDKKGDTMDASGVDMGNQFVWIPVSSEADLTSTGFDENGQPTGVSSGWYEPYSVGYATETEEYNATKTQVLKYGGFYIGRYEAGVNTTTLRTKVTTTQTVVCKKGVAPYNYVPWGKEMNDVNTAFNPGNNNPDSVSTNGAVYLAKSMYSSSSSVTSTLIYGCEWDAMCRYIGDSQRMTYYNETKLTGSDSTNVSKYIYELAGNLEWTMEVGYDQDYLRDYRIMRGNKINRRVTNDPINCSDSYSFRPVLYIK